MATPSFLSGTLTERFTAASSSSDSFSYNSGSTGSNRVIVAMVMNQSGAFDTSATYNGVSLTRRTLGTNAIFGVSWFYLVNPPTGANTFTINYAATVGHFYHLFVLQDVDQTNVFQLDGGAEANPGTSATVTLATTTANQLLISWIGCANAITVNAAQTSDYNAQPGTYFMALSHSTPDTTTNTSHNYTFSSALYSMGMVSFLPAGGAAATPIITSNLPTLMAG